MAAAKNFHNIRLANGRFAPKGTKSKAKVTPKKKVDAKGKEIWDMFVLDRSSSMNSIKKQTIEGFNTVLSGIKEVAKDMKLSSFCSLIQFDYPYEINTIYSAKPAEECEGLNNTNFVPRGNTALYDAIGRAITHMKDTLGAKINNKDIQVTITILTDGEENASREYNSLTIRQLIEEVKNTYNWTVNYIGAGEDKAVKNVASSLGITTSNVASFTATGEGTRGLFQTYSNARKAKSVTYATTGENNNFGFFSND